MVGGLHTAAFQLPIPLHPPPTPSGCNRGASFCTRLLAPRIDAEQAVEQAVELAVGAEQAGGAVG